MLLYLLLGLLVSSVLAGCPYAQGKAWRGNIDIERAFPKMPASHPEARGLPAHGKKGAFLMNRIGPSTSTLYLANLDGTNERQLFNGSTTFDSHATFSPDGKYITFTTERNGDGNSDIYRCSADGSDVTKVLATSSFEDGLVLSPNGSLAAYVSTANGFKSNIWLLDLATNTSRNLTNTDGVKGVSWSPDGYFKPSFSPDGEWLLFSSDRNTDWTGHGNGTGWEHTQTLSIYVIRPNGNDFRQVVSKANYSLGSPAWSPDGSRIVYYEITREDTWSVHRPEDLYTTTSQIVSVDFATGLDRRQETIGDGVKLSPQYITATEIGYLTKGVIEGLSFTSNHSSVTTSVRSPSWSPDGKTIVYEKTGWDIRPMETKLHSWSNDWEYRFTDVFPSLSSSSRLAITQKQLGNSSIVTMNPDGTDVQLAFDVYSTGQLDTSLIGVGLAGAFGPDWSPDSEWITFGLGAWFQDRALYTASIYRVTSNGSTYEQLTDGSVNSGFPSYSHDGSEIVYRIWSNTTANNGLRILNLASNTTRNLTTSFDNLPHYSPDGTRILFTRRTNATNSDVCTISPTGTDLQILTSSGANDAHAVWTPEGKILYSSGMYGFRTEAALYDDTFQPYGQIMMMDADGGNKEMLTDSMWEDSMPLFMPNVVLY